MLFITTISFDVDNPSQITDELNPCLAHRSTHSCLAPFRGRLADMGPPFLHLINNVNCRILIPREANLNLSAQAAGGSNWAVAYEAGKSSRWSRAFANPASSLNTKRLTASEHSHPRDNLRL
jgi:hypothetical protein